MSMLKDFADKIIAQTERNYDTIAGHFSTTRYDAWPEFGSLKTLIKTVRPIRELALLDIGCGNGRLAAAIPIVHYTGLDLSSQLLKIAQERFPHYTFVHGSVLQLPFPDHQFDIVACVATLQHIPSAAYRRQAIQEIARVLKPGGTLFMLNWNLTEQPQYQQYLTSSGDGYDAGDYLIPWKNDQGKVLAQRYYHGFGIAELTELTEDAELKTLKNELGEDQRNILTIAQKN